MLAPEGSLYVSSLTLAGRRGDRLLRALHRAGEVAEPRSAEAVAALLRAHLATEPFVATQGNFAFLTCDGDAG